MKNKSKAPMNVTDLRRASMNVTDLSKLTLEQRMLHFTSEDAIVDGIKGDAYSAGTVQLNDLAKDVRKAKQAYQGALAATGVSYNVTTIVDAQRNYEELKAFYNECKAQFEADFQGYEEEAL